MSGSLESLGAWLATAYAAYGLVFLFLPAAVFAYVPVLGASVWVAVSHARGLRPWPGLPAAARRWTRLAVELSFGLINPVLYLAVLSSTVPALQSGVHWGLEAPAWVLLAAFWMIRLVGAGVDTGSHRVQLGLRVVLWSALACVVLHGVKDAWWVATTDWGRLSRSTLALNLARLVPLYAIPAVLLWDYAGADGRCSPGDARTWRGLFLLPGSPARIVVFVVLAGGLTTAALAVHMRSEGAVRQLVADHRAAIAEAAARYDVDPRLLAAIVYVTHRDQLSPFRDSLERVVAGAWASNLRGAYGLRPPDRVDVVGTDENPLLNRALDVSVGLAQVKPRTAQAASVLAMGLTPDELPPPARFAYREVEPLGDQWKPHGETRRLLPSPIPVPAARVVVAGALLEARSNLAVAALILALYQRQWETADPAWSLRDRPDVTATLYQIGFAKSKPHPAPRGNAFGTRVRDVMGQAWMAEMFPPQARRLE